MTILTADEVSEESTSRSGCPATAPSDGSHCGRDNGDEGTVRQVVRKVREVMVRRICRRQKAIHWPQECRGRYADREILLDAELVGLPREVFELFNVYRRDQEAVRKNYWTAAASKEELHTFAMSHLNDFPEEFVEPVCCTKIEGMLHPPLLMRDMIPPDLPRGRVTLLGDAIHPMVPCEPVELPQIAVTNLRSPR